MAIVNHLPKLINSYKENNPLPDGNKLTDAQIAQMAGLDPATFSRYKNGNVNSINWDVWERLSVFFGVRGSEIFDVEL